jgi:hypothetical protein
LAEALPALRSRIAAAPNVIIESNSVMKFVRPDVYLTVFDPGTPDFKTSAQEFMDRADAVILHDVSQGPLWTGVSLKPTAGRPVFRITPPPYVTDEIVEFVRTSLIAEANRTQI